MRARWRRTARQVAPTVDVTAFLSLMVILVPFLLVTAVFSRVTILELQSAGEAGDVAMPPDALQLRVIVRAGDFEVNYLGLEAPLVIDRTEDDTALAALADLAEDLKARNPGSLEATVLSEPQIAYDVLVKVLDALRISLRAQGEGSNREPLFPLIALGSAPAGHRDTR